MIIKRQNEELHQVTNEAWMASFKVKFGHLKKVIELQKKSFLP